MICLKLRALILILTLKDELLLLTFDLKMSFSCYRTFGISFTYKFGGYKEKSHEAVDKSRFKQ
jgi:hypothetical protein